MIKKKNRFLLSVSHFMHALSYLKSITSSICQSVQLRRSPLSTERVLYITKSMSISPQAYHMALCILKKKPARLLLIPNSKPTQTQTKGKKIEDMHSLINGNSIELNETYAFPPGLVAHASPLACLYTFFASFALA